MFFQHKNLQIKTPSSLNCIRKSISILVCCAGLSVPAKAQALASSSFASYAEKIYLQLDNNVYTADQIVWFKAIVANASDQAPTELSGVLHVDLIDANEKIVESKLLKLDRGIGDGFFQLSQGYSEGLYLIRAYTEWDKNFGSDFFFQEYIQVFASSAKVKPIPIRNVTLVEEHQDECRLRVTFDPLAIDSLHTKELTIFLSLDGRIDTLVVEKDGTNGYRLDYAIPANSRFITMQMQTKNHFKYSKAIVLEKNYLDLQFFPESGELVQGLPALLGFKALDSSGKGKIVAGDILNGKGNIVTSFKSNQLGMGTVLLNKVDSSEKYMARVVFGGNLQKLYPLPAIVSKGNVLSVRKVTNKLFLEINSNYLVKDSVFIQVSCRGSIYFDVKGRMQDGRLAFSLLSNNLPEGVIDFTLMDPTRRPIAERLYFNQRPESRMNIQVTTDKESYIQREPTRLKIETTDATRRPVPASLSLLVINKSRQGQLQDARQNILSYFLLNADLKGEIENPGYYFAKEGTRDDDIDALLLTQGWRKYKYTREVARPLLQPEFNLMVSGAIKGGVFNHKNEKGIGLTMMTFGTRNGIQEQVTDSMGRFGFVLDEYGRDLNILIQSKARSGKKKNYSITLDKKETPPIVFDPVRLVEEPDSIIKAYVRGNIERKKEDDTYKNATEGITLDSVVVKSYFMSPERKRVADEYGKPKTVIEGDAIRAKEAKWSYGLYSVLLFNFPDKVKMTRLGDGTLFASLYNGELTLVVVDGIAVKAEDYPLIAGIPPSEVKSFELIEYAKNFGRLYCEALPQNCGMNAPSTGNVIAIYTYAGKGLFGSNAPVGIMKTAIQAFAAPREFYAPKYEQLQPRDWLKPDLRTLVYWDPNVRIDSLGMGSAIFYNADNTGTMQVIVEAISQDGEIGYEELFFEVKKRH